MPAQRQMQPLTPRLSEAARHVVYPKSIVTSGLPKVAAQCAEMGVVFDPWQTGVGTLALGKRADGKYAATVGGVVLSIPRQVGKTFLVGMILIALCVLFPRLTVLWTAHHGRTTTMTFQTMQGMVRRRKIWPHVQAIRTANGEQEIRFKNESVIMFGAREFGFGRGFAKVDVEVFDEAQKLSSAALDDMVPAVNQSEHESGGLIFFMGTPPRPKDDGDEFANRRQKALSGKAENMVYVEFSADSDADPDDQAQWAKANPSFPHRTPIESMERMREQLTDEDSFMREALGVWDSNTSTQVIDPESWQRAGDTGSVPSSRFVLAVDVSPDQARSSVAFAGLRADGLVHVELYEQRSGSAWLAGWIAEKCAANDIAAVVVDEASPAAPLVAELRRRKVRQVVSTGARDMASACADFYSLVEGGELRHTDQPQVNAALAVARKRSLGDGWAWNRKSADADITPIVAATLAVWGVRSGRVRGGNKERAGGRRVVTW